MKKLKIIAFATGLVGCIVSAKAQTNNQDVLAMSFRILSLNPEAGKSNRAAVLTSKAGIRAVKYFDTHFRDGTDVKWFAGKDVITASFDRDGIKTNVLYSNKGWWIRTMANYYEDKMPRDIRELVKRSEYFDDRITFVQEIQEGEILLYVVHLENEKEHKQIIVYDGEISLYKKFDKQS